jgi:two-component system response regulator NreC
MPDLLPPIIEAPTVTVVIADDHRVVRTGLKLLLGEEPDVEVIGEAGDSERALALVAELEPDVLVLDLNMPGRSGLEAIPDVAAASPHTRVVVLTMQSDLGFARTALQAGAGAFVLKDAADTELKRAVRSVAMGRTYLSPELGARLAAGEGEPAPAPQPLTGREQEVLRLIALGHTNAEMAELLEISIRTVESHRSHISQKLGLSTRAELVRKALELHLLD